MEHGGTIAYLAAMPFEQTLGNALAAVPAPFALLVPIRSAGSEREGRRNPKGSSGSPLEQYSSPRCLGQPHARERPTFGKSLLGFGLRSR